MWTIQKNDCSLGMENLETYSNTTVNQNLYLRVNVPSHTFFFNSFLLLLLLPLGISMIIHYSPVESHQSRLIITVELFKVLAMLQDRRQEFLVLLSSLAFGFQFLLFFQLLGRSGFTESLTFCSFVCFHIDSSLQSRITSGAAIISLRSCLWKLRQRKARSSICAWIRRSSGMLVGKLLSWSILAVILAATLKH